MLLAEEGNEEKEKRIGDRGQGRGIDQRKGQDASRPVSYYLTFSHKFCKFERLKNAACKVSNV